MATDAHRLQTPVSESGGLQGNRAERKLRAFARQVLSGVMATGADYPTLHQHGREERKEGWMEGTQADKGVRSETCKNYLRSL